jgi:hypothetical protein
MELAERFWTRWLKANKKSDLKSYKILKEVFETDENGFVTYQTITSLNTYFEDLVNTIEKRIHESLYQEEE